MEKQDFILSKQKEQMAAQEQKLEELTLKVDDVEQLLDEVAEVAYDKAVEVVTDTVWEQTQAADLQVLDDYQKSVAKSGNTPQVKKIADQLLSRAKEKLREAAGKILHGIQAALLKLDARKAGQAEIKQRAKDSIMTLLQRAQLEAKQRNQERSESEKNAAMKHKQNMDL